MSTFDDQEKADILEALDLLRRVAKRNLRGVSLTYANLLLTAITSVIVN